MASFWLSDNLTTQNWMADRAEFMFLSITSRLSDYYQAQMSDQLQYTEILHGVSEEIAIFDAYNNWLQEQDSATQQDPVFANYTQAPLFNLTTAFPDANWYDTFYLNFLTQLGAYFLEPSTTQNIQNVFNAYFQQPFSTVSPGVQVSELYNTHGADTAENIVDQHIINVRLPAGQALDKTTLDAFTVFDQIRQAHTVMRVIVDPAAPDLIHGATINDPYLYKMYVREDRNPVEDLTWNTYPSGWYQQFTGPFSERSQAMSGVFTPGTLPNARYKSSVLILDIYEDWVNSGWTNPGWVY